MHADHELAQATAQMSYPIIIVRMSNAAIARMAILCVLSSLMCRIALCSRSLFLGWEPLLGYLGIMEAFRGCLHTCQVTPVSERALQGGGRVGR